MVAQIFLLKVELVDYLIQIVMELLTLSITLASTLLLPKDNENLLAYGRSKYFWDKYEYAAIREGINSTIAVSKLYQPGAQGHPVQRADHRLAAFHDRMETFPRASVMTPRDAGSAAAFGPRLHVGAGGKHLARTDQYGNPNIVPVADRVEDLHHLVHETRVLRIYRRMVHRNHGDMIGDGAFDEFGVHCFPARL